MRAKQVGLLICLILVGYTLTMVTDDAHAEYLSVMHSQVSPLSSPLTVVARPTLQSSLEQSPLEATESIQAFRRQLPFYSGSQANQTSPVLIGAVLIGLAVVGILVINRE